MKLDTNKKTFILKQSDISVELKIGIPKNYINILVLTKKQ